ncbi:GNAT family N-acetyltransferase, partial [Kineococcus sp. R8]|uniref:GNAT family N-acetyltransferase n=1 Tax=Kineococcus siccus TaxID=2696567 RepID=UPI001412F6DB
AEGGDGRAAGYLLLDVVDGAGHVEQVSVHPAHGRRGLGRALLASAATWALGHGLGALTLTTYADVPWNAPLYSRLGFRILRPHEQGPQLRALRRHEADSGLDAWPRVAMRRVLAAPAPRGTGPDGCGSSAGRWRGPWGTLGA